MELSKNKKEIVLLGVLTLVLLIMAPRLLSGKKYVPLTDSTGMSAADRLLAASKFSPSIESLASAGKKAQADEKSQLSNKYIRDIFDIPAALKIGKPVPKPKIAKKGPEAAKAPEIKISGFIWGEKKPAVFVDGQGYKVGEFVKGAQITSISSAGIEVLYQGSLFFIEREEPDLNFN